MQCALLLCLQQAYIRDLYRILRAQRFCRCLFSSRKRERFRDACFSLFPFSNLHLQLYNNSFFCFPSIQEQQNLDFLERRQKRCTRMLFHQELWVLPCVTMCYLGITMCYLGITMCYLGITISYLCSNMLLA